MKRENIVIEQEYNEIPIDRRNKNNQESWLYNWRVHNFDQLCWELCYLINVVCICGCVFVVMVFM